MGEFDLSIRSNERPDSPEARKLPMATFICEIES